MISDFASFWGIIFYTIVGIIFYVVLGFVANFFSQSKATEDPLSEEEKAEYKRNNYKL